LISLTLTNGMIVSPLSVTVAVDRDGADLWPSCRSLTSSDNQVTGLVLGWLRRNDNGDVMTGIALNVLGPVEVRRGGALVAVEGLKRRQLLAVLVAARGSEVSAERLCEALWEGALPDSARASLQSHVSRLRRALMPDQLIRAGGIGYAIDMGLVELDAARFDDLAHAQRVPRKSRRSNAPLVSGGAPRSASSPNSPACAARRCGWRSCG
jgi:DNA-binding winged helix-turn-helix (wHTH) protein